MSMIRRDPEDKSLVTTAQHAGAGAAVMVVAVVALNIALQTVISALMLLGAVVVIGVILYYAFLRKQFRRA